MTVFTRRRFIAAGAALPLAHAAAAGAPMLGASAATHRRFKLGDFEVTTILAASMTRPDPHSIFGLNVDAQTFEAAADAALLPKDQAQFFFTPTVVNTGAELVLFDTGLNTEGITAALASAGYTPEQIDVVVITHMHGDHIGGLIGAEGKTFPNARYVTGAKEFDAWSDSGNDNFDAKVQPLAGETTMLAPGQDALPGITAVAAFGHTPGHMNYMLDSAGQSLLIAADFANHYVFSLAYPDWEVKFDMDKSAAAATRRAVLDRLVADRIPFIGYHMPFPAVGYVEKAGSGYRYLPESYQLRL